MHTNISYVVLMSVVLTGGQAETGVGLVNETRAMIYLMRYGYVAPNTWSDSLVTEEQYRATVNNAVSQFQAEMRRIFGVVFESFSPNRKYLDLDFGP